MSKKVECQCGYCGQKFMRFPSLLGSSRSGLLFCSNSCRATFLAEPNRRDDLKCHYCEKRFSRSLSEIAKGSKDHIYCSRRCYEQHRQEVIASRHIPVGRGGKHPVNCEQCGKEFYIKPSILMSLRKHYCSRECKRLGSITVGTFVPKPHIRRTRPMRCEKCGINDPATLEIHHKDRNRKNNNLDNLIVLCANCHARAHRGK